MVKKSAPCADRASFQSARFSACCFAGVVGSFSLLACGIKTSLPQPPVDDPMCVALPF